MSITQSLDQGGAHNQGLVQFQISPRASEEPDVNARFQQLVDTLRKTRTDLKDYKKVIE